jgi:hypothetical protein
MDDALAELLGHDFRINIELGNDAMSTPEDVAGALEQVAKRLRDGARSGIVKDANGATVGDFEFD